MKKLFLISTVIILTGCATAVPVKQKFPEAPADMFDACPDLTLTPPTQKLSDVLKVVTDNYSKYHECQLSVDSWIKWYKVQREIYNQK